MLQKTVLIAQPENKKQIKKLNSLEAQAWLYKSILERFSEKSVAKPLKVAYALEALEQKRQELESELSPSMPWNYRLASRAQKAVRVLGKTQAEQDYEGLETFAENFVSIARRQQPSRTFLVDILTKAPALKNIAAQNVSPQRLRLVYKVEELLNTILAKTLISEDGFTSGKAYQEDIFSLNAQIQTLSQQLENVLSERQQALSILAEEKEEARIGERERKYLKKQIVSQSADISRYESTVIQLSDDLSRQAGDADFFKGQSQDLKNQLQNYRTLNRKKILESNALKKEFSSLENRLEAAEMGRRNLRIELTRAQHELKTYLNENARLISKASELEKSYSQLLSAYEQQVKEIQRLQNELANQSQSAKATRDRITEDEYKKVTNPGDWEFVQGYTNRFGTFVSPYYRRKRKRKKG